MPPLDRQTMTVTARQQYEAAARTAMAGQRLAGGDVGALIEPLCKAIGAAHEQWRRQAFFAGIVINGPIAQGGRLEGPPLEPFMRQELSPRPGDPTGPIVEAITKALSHAWTDFQASVRVPGRPWYPSFAAVAAPQAPPTPNVPDPLSSCTFDRSTIDPNLLAQRMASELRTPDRVSGPLFAAIANAFSRAVGSWVQVQMITGVMGKGPVPTQAPPYVPVGPVVMGDNIPLPGHLMP